jgi:Secretory lipase
VLVAAVSLAWRNIHGATDSNPDVPQPVASADLSGSGPGSLLSAMTMPGFAASWEGSMVRSARITYRSTSGDTGKQTVVSGSVFVPNRRAPKGGWPVISYGHGTTGLNEPCAPSLSYSLLGAATFVAAFARLGYAVAFADYQGLGAPGVHPYLDAKTAGLNMIDATRALRHTFPDVSNRWAAVGGSQGGAAAWAADEQAASYAPELDLVGAVAFAPPADVSRAVDKAQAGTLTIDQLLAFAGVVETIARLHTDVNRDDYRRGAAAQYWDALTACSGPELNERGPAVKALQPGDLAPATPEAADRLRNLVLKWVLPQRPVSAPLSVVYGGRDTFIDAEWTTDAIRRACAIGGPILADLQPDKGHADVDVTSRVDWIADRFAGKPVTSNCP